VVSARAVSGHCDTHSAVRAAMRACRARLLRKLLLRGERQARRQLRTCGACALREARKGAFLDTHAPAAPRAPSRRQPAAGPRPSAARSAGIAGGDSGHCVSAAAWRQNRTCKWRRAHRLQAAELRSRNRTSRMASAAPRLPPSAGVGEAARWYAWCAGVGLHSDCMAHARAGHARAECRRQAASGWRTVGRCCSASCAGCQLSAHCTPPAPPRLHLLAPPRSPAPTPHARCYSWKRADERARCGERARRRRSQRRGV
jgi:hypothetical protein